MEKKKHECDCDRCRRADHAEQFIEDMGGPETLNRIEISNPKLVKHLAAEYGIEL